ncbi:MAG: hypothetical protein KA712_07945 [Myxococcales bacterium]|nr:hypothetical protein [Myxococcales bacterium]
MAHPLLAQSASSAPSGRRNFLIRVLAGGSAAALRSAGIAGIAGSAACGVYPAEDGAAYEPWHYPPREPLEPVELNAVAAAILAASPHNTQPWLFEVRPGRVDLFADTERSLGAMDPFHREMTMGLGCAIENLVTGATQFGLRADVVLLPVPEEPNHVARITLTPDSTVVEDPLAKAIPNRHTHRGAYMENPMPAAFEAAFRGEVANALTRAVPAPQVTVGSPPVSLYLIQSVEDKARFRQATIDATRAINADADMSHDGHAWYRHSAKDIDTHRDGVTIDATGNGATLRTFGKALPAPSASSAGNYWLDATKGAQTTAGAFGILATPDRYSRIEQLICGRVFQRLHLWATSEGLAIQPLNQLPERQDREKQLSQPEQSAALLASFMESRTDVGAQFLFRIGYAWDPVISSPRRPVAWVVRAEDRP